MESDALIGRHVGGHFRIDELIGAGATGRVYLAEQLDLERPVAVKVLHPALASDDKLLDRFRNEALLASRLSHPNIAAVYECSRPGDEIAFIAMEYVPGKNLYQLLESEAPLSIDRVVDLFTQLLDGLEEAHAEGIVHADLKSPNIVVTQTRAGHERPKLVDFGIALLRPDKKTRPEFLCGTPEYLAPEVITGLAPCVASDIYGAGIILFEMLCGKPPFHDRSLERTLRKQLEAPIPRLSRSDSGELDRLQTVVDRALAKDPNKRYRSVAELRSAVIAAHIRGSRRPRPVTIKPPSWRRAPTARCDQPATVDVRRPTVQ